MGAERVSGGDTGAADKCFSKEESADSADQKNVRTIIKKGVDITHDRAYNIHVDFKRGINSVVECHLAKVKVASSNLVSSSTSKAVSDEAAFFAGQCPLGGIWNYV